MGTLSNTSIFAQAQAAACDFLNADPLLSGRVKFFAEDQLDIDYSIEKALGDQGIVGVVMTPQATYCGVNDSGELVYDLRDFTVMVTENTAVNRTLSGSVTALDAAARSLDVLGAPPFGIFGQFCPKAVEQGEDGGLIAARATFDCQIRASRTPAPPKNAETVFRYSGTENVVKVEYADGVLGDVPKVLGWHQLDSVTFGGNIVEVGVRAFREANTLAGVTFNEGLTSIGDYAFQGIPSLREVVLPDSVQVICDTSFGGLTILSSFAAGSDLSAIEAQAFLNSGYNLSEQTFDFTRCTQVPVLENANAFTMTSPNKRILVPQALYDEWLAAENWSGLEEFIVSDGNAEPAGIDGDPDDAT